MSSVNLNQKNNMGIKVCTKIFTTITFCCFVIICTFTGCKSKDSCSEDEAEYIHAEMMYYNFDQIDNLSVFFDSIRNEHGTSIRNWVWEEYAQTEVVECIEKIEKYRKGQYRYYPDSLVSSLLGTFSLECAYIANHFDGYDMTFAEWFLMCAAYYSPDITYLVQMQTSNHKAGILNLGSAYNYNPWWSYIIFKRNKGFEVRRIKDDDVLIEKIFQIQDEDGRLYYLCSNNTEMCFLQQLYWVKEDDNIVLVKELDTYPQNLNLNFDELYYDPNLKKWYYCKKNNDASKYLRVSETPALCLKLDGRNSCFIQ